MAIKTTMKHIVQNASSLELAPLQNLTFLLNIPHQQVTAFNIHNSEIQFISEESIEAISSSICNVIDHFMQFQPQVWIHKISQISCAAGPTSSFEVGVVDFKEKTV